MNEITEISSKEKNNDRLDVCLDGRFAFKVDYETAVKFGLKVGKVLTEEDVSAIYKAEGESAAFNRGLKYAVKKTVSEKQMREYLVRNGFTGSAVEVAIQKLKSYDYINDVRFADAYVATYASERGSKRIEFELKNAGINDEIIANALGATDESASCARCLEKYLRTHKNADRQKAVNYLLYRGFNWDTINEAVGRSNI